MNARMQTQDAALVIVDGSLPGLVATWAEGVMKQDHALDAPANASLAWMPPTDAIPARERRELAARKQSQISGIAGILFDEPIVRLLPGPGTTGDGLMGLGQSTLLMSALALARKHGLNRVVWPIHAGAVPEINLHDLADVTDRALLAAQLVAIDAPGLGATPQGSASLRIDTPFADMTDAELLDLALDMDVPVGLAWSCLNEGDHPCGTCADCARWKAALGEVDPQGLLRQSGVVSATL